MSNSYYGDIIILDTFTSDILVSLRLKAIGQFRLNSIEWQKPTTLDHNAVIYDTNEMVRNTLFDETCTVVKQSLLKYFFGLQIRDIYIPSGSVDSGKIIILLNPRTS
jgi:hypothetical protein